MCKKSHHSFARLIFCVYLQPAKSMFNIDIYLEDRNLAYKYS